MVAVEGPWISESLLPSIFSCQWCDSPASGKEFSTWVYGILVYFQNCLQKIDMTILRSDVLACVTSNFVWQGDNPTGWAAKCQIEKCWGTVFKILNFNCPILRLTFFPHWKYGNTISTAAKVWYVVDISLQVSVPPTTLISTLLKLKEVKQKPAMEHCRTQVGWKFHAVWSQLAPEIHVVGWWWQLATSPQTAREFELVLLGSFQDDSRMLSLVN